MSYDAVPFLLGQVLGYNDASMPSRPLVTEDALRQSLAHEGLAVAERWSNSPQAIYATHEHPYGKVLVVVSGSITFAIDGGKRHETLQAGDRLTLAPHTPHSAVVGSEGVICLEAHVR